jgi:hypothetical protein
MEYYSFVRRPVWFRALIAMWGLWFTAALSEAPGLHACSVHAVHAGHATHSEDDTHGAQLAGSVVSPDDSASPAPVDQSHHRPTDCTCLGTCCCAAPAAVPTRSVKLPNVVVVAERAVDFADAASPIVQRAYSRPFANGPPVA